MKPITTEQVQRIMQETFTVEEITELNKSEPMSPQLIKALQNYGREDIMVIAGGVIPAQDYKFLYEAGVIAIFGPGTRVSEAGKDILKVLLETYS